MQQFSSLKPQQSIFPVQILITFVLDNTSAKEVIIRIMD